MKKDKLKVMLANFPFFRVYPIGSMSSGIYPREYSREYYWVNPEDIIGYAIENISIRTRGHPQDIPLFILHYIAPMGYP